MGLPGAEVPGSGDRDVSPCCFGVRFFLEDSLGPLVHLVTDKALRPQWPPCVEREAVLV
jgi:predicted nucleotidyltransferase